MENNVNIGTATAVITGIGKFFGTKEISYVIETHRWNGAMKTVKEPTALVYGRAERKCTVCGKTESKQLAKLSPKMKVNVSSIVLKTGQSTTR